MIKKYATKEEDKKKITFAYEQKKKHTSCILCNFYDNM